MQTLEFSFLDHEYSIDYLLVLRLLVIRICLGSLILCSGLAMQKKNRKVTLIIKNEELLLKESIWCSKNPSMVQELLREL